MSSIVEKRAAAREVIDILCEISTILVRILLSYSPSLDVLIKSFANVRGAQNTHLDRTTLSICVSLIENGVNPEALAVSVQKPGFSHKSDMWRAQVVIQEIRKNGGKVLNERERDRDDREST